MRDKNEKSDNDGDIFDNPDALALFRRLDAFNEAAHAAMLCFFGLRRGVQPIELNTTAEGCTVRRPKRPLEHIAQAPKQEAIQIAKRLIMCNLAGPCIHYLGDNGDDAESFADWICEEVCEEIGGVAPDGDERVALSAAQLACGDSDEGWDLFYLAASWTQECLQLPEMLRVVEALGTELELRDLKANEVKSIIEGASDTKRWPLYRHLGQKWRRRFPPPAQE